MTTEERLLRLERELRIWRGVVVGSAVIAASILVVSSKAAPVSVPRDLEASSIRVVNKHGQHSATLAATDDGFVTLSFRDMKGTLRASLLMTPSGESTFFVSDGKASRVELGAVRDSKSNVEQYSVAIRNEKGDTLWRPPVDNVVTEQ